MTLKPQKIISSDRKTIYLCLNKFGELIVKAPKTMPESFIYDIIDKYKDVLLKQRKRILSQQRKIKKHLFQENEEFLFLGRRLKLRFVPDYDLFSNQVGIMTTDRHLLLPERFVKSANKEIENFYRNEAKKIFESRVQFYIEKYYTIFGEKLVYSKIKITNGINTVGSCSPKNGLNFSWRLIQAPIRMVDYVVAHEIVHLKEKHHQKSFWEKMKMLVPDYRKNIEWLKENWFYLKEFLL